MDGGGELSDGLERETAILRRIARGVLLEPGLAEDAVQEAWLAALQARRAEASGGWMTEAVRRIARGLKRSEARRAVRERSAARKDELPSAADTAARVELLRELLEALRELEEPYRTALQLRLVEDLPPRAIAARTGVPVETARTRIKRGVERLRARLDARHAHRRDAFLAALAPLVQPVGWSAPFAKLGLPETIGGAVMSTQAKLAAAAALALAIGVWWTRSTAPSAPRAEAPASAEPQADRTAGAESRESLATEPAPLETAERDEVEPSSARTAASHSATWVVRGLALRGPEQPFPDAPVAVTVIAGYEGEGSVLKDEVVRSDRAGAFSLALDPPVTAVRIVVRLKAADFIAFRTERLVLRGADAPTDLQVLAYPLDLAIHGRVLDEQGSAVAGAHVAAFDQVADTGADGRFTIASSSIFRETPLEAWADGFALARAAVTSNGPGSLRDVELRLSPADILRGRVTDERGRAIQGAELQCFGRARTKAVSGADGRFELPGLPRDESWLAVGVRASGFPLLRHVFENGRVPAEPIELVLASGVELAGRVVDPEGRGVPGAEVCVGDSPYDFEAVRGIAGDEGRFAVSAVPRNAKAIQVQAESFAPTRVALALPAEGPFSGELELVLQRGRIVGGIVVDANGAPIAKLGLAVLRDREYVDGLQSKTDDHGRFELAGVPDAPRLSLELYGRNFVRRDVPFEAGQRDLRIVMERAAGLCGRVIDVATGEPVRAFRVRFVSPALREGELHMGGYSSTWAVEGHEVRDEQGRWDTEGEELEVGTVTGIEITAPGYGPAVLARAFPSLAPEESPIVIALGPPGSVAGRVVDARDGRPIAGASVQRFSARDGSLNRYDEHASAQTDARGEFVLDDLAIEPMGLVVEADGYAPAADGPFELGGGPRRIELSPGATLRGVLRDAAGRGLAGQPVNVSAPGVAGRSDRSWRSLTDAGGAFELANLAPGNYQVALELRHENGSVFDLARNVAIAEARTYEVELRPNGNCRVVGTVRSAGEVPAVMTISAWSEDAASTGGTRWRAAIARDGRFEIDGLTAGPWKFSATEVGVFAGGRSALTEALVAEGADTPVVIELAGD